MTNQELAIKIMKICGGLMDAFTRDQVTSQLNEAVSDALKDREIAYEKDLKMRVDKAVLEGVNYEKAKIDLWTGVGRDAYANGFASARDMAAGIVEQRLDQCRSADQLYTLPENNLERKVEAQIFSLAACIRSMSPEGGKEG